MREGFRFKKKIVCGVFGFVFILSITACGVHSEKAMESGQITSEVENGSVAVSSVLDERQAEKIVCDDWDSVGFRYDKSLIHVSNIQKFEEGYFFVMKYLGEGARLYQSLLCII